MATQTKGYCKYCGKAYTRSGMLKHLASCEKRKIKLAQETGKTVCGYFQIVIVGKYDKRYWLIIEMNENATLQDLDSFIRDIWVECCGHLSSFEIRGVQYDSYPDTSGFWGMPAKSLKYKLKQVVEVGDKIKYEYDFGSTTELEIHIHSYRVGNRKKEKIALLSRNNPIENICSQCGKNAAKYVDATQYYEEDLFWCAECVEQKEMNEEYFLPVCNSPRMGVCGYEGSAIYPDQFEPDKMIAESSTPVKIESSNKKKDIESKAQSSENKQNEAVSVHPNLEEWRRLYESASRIKELKLWDKFGDMDLIGIQNGAKEDTVFFCILGRGGECYGISVYEGYEGLNDFFMIAMHEALNLPFEYVMGNQRNLTCYWGNRDELSEEQRKIIKELGYKYRGKNQWMYFMSFEAGYAPGNLKHEELVRMIEHFENLELAAACYEKMEGTIDFKNGNMFWLNFKEDKKSWDFGEKPLPFTAFRLKNLIIDDEKLIEKLKQVKKNEMIWEVDLIPMLMSIADKKYQKPVNPTMCLIGEVASGMMIGYNFIGPEQNAMTYLADELIDIIFKYGAPKEIRVSNIVIEAGIEQLCNICGIELKCVKTLPNLQEFKRGMEQFL